jgi:hypothetical protein
MATAVAAVAVVLRMVEAAQPRGDDGTAGWDRRQLQRTTRSFLGVLVVSISK